MKAKRKFFQGRQKGDNLFLKLILKFIIANSFKLKYLTKLSYMSCGSNSHLSLSGICTATIKRETIIGKNKKNLQILRDKCVSDEKHKTISTINISRYDIFQCFAFFLPCFASIALVNMSIM